MQPIFLKPVFKERIWGGTKLRELYGYDIPSEHTGECWAVSAHPNGQSVVVNGEYAGTALGDLWEQHPELFGSSAVKFPLLTKILDASDDLSVQVHPEDAYAMENENGELGKTECWYIVDAEPGAEIIFGHRAQTREQLSALIDNGQWDELLEHVPVRAGDFFYVPSGTIHALGKGIVVLETQQSSDTTYRVYDYDRRDAEGNLRELHLTKAIEITTIPHQAATTEYRKHSVGQTEVLTYVSNSFFTVQKWNVAGPSSFEAPAKFTIVSVLSGEGTLAAGNDTYALSKGDHFIVPLGFGGFQLDGSLELIVSHE